jgi:membrane peptidoglycan carboxypeptidase
MAGAVWVGDPAHKRRMVDISIGGQWHAKVFGGEVPGPIWRDMMSGALEGKEAPDFHLVNIPDGKRDKGDDNNKGRDKGRGDGDNGDNDPLGGLLGGFTNGGFTNGGGANGGNGGAAGGATVGTNAGTSSPDPDPTFSLPEGWFQGQDGGGNGNIQGNGNGNGGQTG